MLYSQMHPSASQDFTLDLTTLAGGETVTAFAWQALAGITFADRSATLPTVTTRIAASAAGRYVLSGEATLSSGQIRVVNLTLLVTPVEVSTVKDPLSTEDFQLQWGSGTITASAWSGSLTLSGQSYSGATSISRIAGGTAGTTYRVTNTATFSDGQIGACDLVIRAQLQ